MTEKEIYLIRHGETDLNKLGIVQGRGMNTDLNETGIKQANAFFQQYKAVPFDKIYISSLKRTYQTVKQFIDLGIPYEALPGLDELCWGEWEGKPNTAESRRVFLELAKEWERGDYNARAVGGESPAEVLVRLQGAMDIIFSHENEKTVLICMHGRAMRLLLCQLTGQPLSKMPSFPHQNTSLYRIMVSAAGLNITDFNNFTHLNALSEQD